MLQLDPKFKPLLLEALEDLMYKLSMQLKDLKGGPLTPERKALTEKQDELEELQHIISLSDTDE